jgi:hypothetical protein
MGRVHDFLAIIDDPDVTAATASEAGDDDALLALLVHLAFSDGIVEGDEFALLRRVRPNVSDNDLMMWAMEASGQTMNWDALIAAVPDEASRWATLQVAARMVCLDGNVANDELRDLRALAVRLQLDDDAVEDAVDQVVARVHHATPESLSVALRNMLWDVLVPDREPMSSTLAAVVPEGPEFVCRVLVHGATPMAPDEEVAGVFREGIAAHFDSGPAYVPWSTIRRYTRVPVPGAAFHLHTDTGHLAMSDPRMRDLGKLLDVVFGRTFVEA